MTGWHCGTCDSWVTDPEHYCLPSVTRSPTSPTDADRIVAALDRLTAAIERLAPQEITIKTVPVDRESIAKAARALGIGLSEEALR